MSSIHIHMYESRGHSWHTVLIFVTYLVLPLTEYYFYKDFISIVQDDVVSSGGRDQCLPYLCESEKAMGLTKTLCQSGVILGSCLKGPQQTHAPNTLEAFFSLHNMCLTSLTVLPQEKPVQQNMYPRAEIHLFPVWKKEETSITGQKYETTTLNIKVSLKDVRLI